MKILFKILLFVSFIGIAMFGIFAMSHNDMRDHDGGCFAAITKGIDCPQTINPVAFAFFHLNIFKDFSLAVFNYNTAATILFALTLFFLAGFLVSSPPIFSFTRYNSFRFWLKHCFISSRSKKLVHWLVLHENSPTIL